MGLDISYYPHAKLAQDAELDESGFPVDYDRYIVPTIISDFAAQADDIQEKPYEFDIEKSGGFAAGSYGGYNWWRNELAKMAGHASAEAAWEKNDLEEPFGPLINFADNEGTIGPKTSAELAKDFADHQAKADEIGGVFAERYRDWRIAFEAVADNGFVAFH